MFPTPQCFGWVKKLLQLQDLEVSKAESYMVESAPPAKRQASRYLERQDRFCWNLKIPEDLGRAAGNVARLATHNGYVAGCAACAMPFFHIPPRRRKSPISVAAAAIYMVLALAEPQHHRERGDLGASQPVAAKFLTAVGCAPQGKLRTRQGFRSPPFGMKNSRTAQRPP